MTRVTVDESLRARLMGLDEQLELLDESGKKLGHFLPTEQFLQMVQACMKGLFTDEEVRQAEAQPRDGKSLAEIWRRLGRS